MLAKLLLTFSMVCTIPEFHSEGVCTASTPPPAHSRGFGRSRERGQPWAQQGPGPTGTVAPVSTRTATPVGTRPCPGQWEDI